MKTTLLIMEAGIGSRFGGGIKQLAPVGLDPEAHIHCKEQLDDNDVEEVFYREKRKSVKSYEQLWDQREEFFLFHNIKMIRF